MVMPLDSTIDAVQKGSADLLIPRNALHRR
jgi:hypothetical protein